MEKLLQIPTGDYLVICQKWEEKERGWGSSPDGFSLHLTEMYRERYIQEYWDSMPAQTPDVYEAPDGSPYDVGVGIEIYAELVVLHSLRFATDYMYPGNGGPDDWRQLDR